MAWSRYDFNMALGTLASQHGGIQARDLKLQGDRNCVGLSPLSDGVDEATRFICRCYSNKLGAETMMSDITYKIWAAKFGNTATSAPSFTRLLLPLKLSQKM